MAFCAHYVDDLSQPLHNIENSAYNQANHKDTDGIINDEIMANLDKIKVYAIKIDREESLFRKVTRIANPSVALGYKLEDEKRLLTKQEAYQQVSHSVSLFKEILDYMKSVRALDNQTVKVGIESVKKGPINAGPLLHLPIRNKLD